MALPTVTLGTGDAALEVSVSGFGCMGLTAFYGPAVSNEHAVAVLSKAYELGVRHFDTAQIYQQFGEVVPGTFKYNEEAVGAFIKTVPRDSVTVATKFFTRRDAAGNFIYSREMLMEETENSLKRLGVDYIDLYYLHRMYPESVVPIETFMEHMKELVASGKVRCIGLSEATAETIRRAHAVHPLTCIQQEWSLFARDLEEELVPCCRELGIGIVAYSPVARGMLAGMVRTKEMTPQDWRKSVPYMTEANVEANIRLVDQIEVLAKKNSATLAQLCLAWVIAKGAVPIPGTTKLAHLESNVAACRLRLDAEDVEALEKLGAQVQGLRGDEAYMKNTFHGDHQKP